MGLAVVRKMETSGVPTEAMCRECIERVASSVTFSRARQLQRLLRWLGEHSLARGGGPGATGPFAVHRPNRDNPPTEKEIAEAVLGRSNFDPQSDSLVRKEMIRLREKLARYESYEGSEDEIGIVATGGYVLGFEWRQQRAATGSRRCWLVLPFRSPPEHFELTQEVLEEILLALDSTNAAIGRGGHVPSLDLVSPHTALSWLRWSGDLRQFAAHCHADHVVEGVLKRKAELIEVALWFVDAKTGITQRTGRLSGKAPDELGKMTAKWLLDVPPEA